MLYVFRTRRPEKLIEPKRPFRKRIFYCGDTCSAAKAVKISSWTSQWFVSLKLRKKRTFLKPKLDAFYGFLSNLKCGTFSGMLFTKNSPYAYPVQ